MTQLHHLEVSFGQTTVNVCLTTNVPLLLHKMLLEQKKKITSPNVSKLQNARRKVIGKHKIVTLNYM